MQDPEVTNNDLRPSRIEVANHPGLDLAALGADEVLASWCHLSDIEWQAHHDPPTEEQREQIKLLRGLNQTLDTLPQQNLKFARAVYTAFARSSNEFARVDIGYRMGGLTRLDHDHGYMLWDQLVRDGDSDVRYSAIEAVQSWHDSVDAGDHETAATRLAELGITDDEARQLLDGYEAAQRGERVFDLGTYALRRLTSIRGQVIELRSGRWC